MTEDFTINFRRQYSFRHKILQLEDTQSGAKQCHRIIYTQLSIIMEVSNVDIIQPIVKMPIRIINGTVMMIMLSGILIGAVLR